MMCLTFVDDIFYVFTLPYFLLPDAAIRQSLTELYKCAPYFTPKVKPIFCVTQKESHGRNMPLRSNKVESA